MGLISTKAEIVLVGRNIKYYENLGYEMPRRVTKDGYYRVKFGQKMIVNVCDLPPQSNVLVKVKCDHCGCEYDIKYCTYSKYNRDGKIYCRLCALHLFNSGENNNRWNPNKTDEERETQREYPEYILFSKKVKARDNYLCQVCKNAEHKNLEVHHLDGYDWCKEKRTDVTNGITLCENCHKNFHAIYGKGNNTKDQFEEWIGYTLDGLKDYDSKLPTKRLIICLDNMEIYNGADDASLKTGLNKSSIYACCRHHKKNKTVGGLHFMWLDEYQTMTNEEVQEYIKRMDTRMYSYRKIICISTNEIFNSAKDAYTKYNISRSFLMDACHNRTTYAGRLEDGTPLLWMFYDEYQSALENDFTEMAIYNQKMLDFNNRKYKKTKKMINN